MTHKRVRFIEPVILSSIGAGLLLMTLPPARERVLSFLSPSTPWIDYAGGLALVFLCYGLAFCAMAISSAVLAAKGASLSRRVASPLIRAAASLKTKRPSLSGLRTTRSGDLAGPAAALAIGLGIRAYFLALPLRYDECRTFLRFVNRTAKDLFIYTEPNNHVLHTVGVKLSTLVWGSHPLSIRIPAFLAAIVSIALVYRVARAMDERSGLPSALAAAVFPYLVLFGSIARGYSLLMALVLALVLVGLGYLRDPTRGKVLLFAALSALGLWTMPSMLFAVAGLFVWIAAVRLIGKTGPADLFRRFLAPGAIWTAALTFILYTPVIIASNGVRPILRNRFVAPQPFVEFLHDLPNHVRKTGGDFSRDVPAGVLGAGAVLVLFGLASSFRKKRWAAALLLPSMAVGSVIVLFLGHRIPFPRTWIFLIPIGLVTADLGLSELSGKLPRPGMVLIQAGLIAAAGAFAFHLMAIGAVGRYPDVGTFPEAPAVVEFLKSRVNPGDRIRARVPADEVMKFYLWYNGVAADRPLKEKNTPRNRYFVVKRSRYGIAALTDKPVVKILDLGDAEVYQAERE